MARSLLNALAATMFAGLSLALWRLSYNSTDWAALSLIPLAFVIAAGSWPLALDPWRARLHVALRPNSPLSPWLKGWLQAGFITIVFTFTAVLLLAWQALNVVVSEAVLLTLAFFLSAALFASVQSWLLRHFFQPFARCIATTIVTSIVALPFMIILAFVTWSSALRPGAFLTADLPTALEIGLQNLPERGGWISSVLAIPYGYEAMKIWVVVQLKHYWIVGALFSLDAALFSFILCRSAVVVTQFVEAKVAKAES